MAESARHSVSVAAVVVDDQNRALLIKRADNGHWEPPGGVLELGEDILAGLRREVTEETGLQIQPLALTGVYKNMRQGIVALVFRCALEDGRPGESSEATLLRWASHHEIASLADPAYAIRVLDALSNVTPPAIRAHDGVQLV